MRCVGQIIKGCWGYLGVKGDGRLFGPVFHAPLEFLPGTLFLLEHCIDWHDFCPWGLGFGGQHVRAGILRVRCDIESLVRV